MGILTAYFKKGIIMSKSAIYTANTNAQALAAGSIINLGSIIRRFGQNINLASNNIAVSGAGYYKVNADITITGTTAGTVSVNMLKDGTQVVGATSSVSVAVGDVVTIPLQALVREYGCCCDNNSNLTFVLSGTAETVSNITVTVEKI